MDFSKDKAKEILKKWKSELEHLNLQMNLGAAEARDEFENVKKRVKDWSHEMDERLDKMEDSGKETYRDLKIKLEELRLQSALGKAEAEDAFQEQKKNLSRKLNEVEAETKKAFENVEGKAKEFAAEANDGIRNFETNVDLLWIQFNLGKSEAKEYWQEKKKDISYKIQEMSGKIDRQLDDAEHKWEDFSGEMKNAWSHVKKAFKS